MFHAKSFGFLFMKYSSRVDQQQRNAEHDERTTEGRQPSERSPLHWAKHAGGESRRPFQRDPARPPYPRRRPSRRRHGRLRGSPEPGLGRSLAGGADRGIPRQPDSQRYVEAPTLNASRNLTVLLSDAGAQSRPAQS